MGPEISELLIADELKTVLTGFFEATEEASEITEATEEDTKDTSDEASEL